MQIKLIVVVSVIVPVPVTKKKNEEATFRTLPSTGDPHNLYV